MCLLAREVSSSQGCQGLAGLPVIWWITQFNKIQVGVGVGVKVGVREEVDIIVGVRVGPSRSLHLNNL